MSRLVAAGVRNRVRNQRSPNDRVRKNVIGYSVLRVIGERSHGRLGSAMLLAQASLSTGFLTIAANYR